MIYHTICPLCQTVCARDEHDMFGNCDHKDSGFHYNFVETDRAIIVDIVAGENYVMLNLADKGNACYIKSGKKEILLNTIPFSWNNFEIESFIKKVEKILEMKTFL